MKVIPATATGRTTGSELKVMTLLRSVDWGESAVAIHSLNLAENEHKRWGEIDFVVIGRGGILVVEVKGGEVACRDGVWMYEDGYGRIVRRRESPLVQAKGAYFDLIDKYLKLRFGHQLDEAPTGFCAILAGATRRSMRPLMGGPEFPSDLWGCREDVNDKGALQAFLGRALAHWRESGRGRQGSLPDALVREVVGYLRPNFERVQSLSLSLAGVSREQVELTQDQYACLDMWEGARRILASGPAGCGKTFVAVEMARRAAADGARVLFVTGTTGLARELARKEFSGNFTLLPFESLAGEAGNDSYDLLVVDEGQLLLRPDALVRLGDSLQGGLTGGRWAWFGDPTFQGVKSAEARACYERLNALASVTPRLQQNCRNTPQVVAAVELCSGAPIGHARVRGAGPVVQYLEAPTTIGLSAVAAGKIKEWVEGGVLVREIVLLVGRDDGGAFASAVAAQIGIPPNRWEEASATREKVLGWAVVDDFRGLESPFVLLSALEGDRTDEELQQLLYLGMSRPNLGLALVITTNMRDRLRVFNEASYAHIVTGHRG